MAATITPSAIFDYGPLALNTPEQAATAFWSSDYTGTDKKVIIWADGGGWVNTTAPVKTVLDQEAEPELYSAVQNGHVVVSASYTKSDAGTPGAGAFTLENLRQRNDGTDTWYEIDSSPTPLQSRFAESDLAHLIQYLQHVGIPGSGMSADPQDFVIGGESAGFMSAAWSALGPNRADSTAAVNTRFAKPTRVGGLIGYRTIAAWRHYLAIAGIIHLGDGAGGLATTVGGALAAPGGDERANEASPAWTATATAEARLANAKLPVYLFGYYRPRTNPALATDEYSIDEAGPFGFGDIADDTLSAVHPLEAPHTLRDALASLPGSHHAECSEFAVNQRRLDGANLKLPNAYVPSPIAQQADVLRWLEEVVWPSPVAAAEALAQGKDCPTVQPVKTQQVKFRRRTT